VPSIDLGPVGFVSSGSLPAINTTTAFTVSFWHRNVTGGTTTSQDILRNNLTTNGSRSGYFIQLTTLGRLMLRIQAAGSEVQNIVTASTVAERGRWIHFAGTYNATGTVCFGYVNGKFSGRTGSAGTIALPATLQTSVLGNESSGQIPSQIFDFQMHTGTALEAADIPLLMRPDLRLPSLTVRWFGLGFRSMGSGQRLVDESGNGNDVFTNNGIQSGPEPPWRATLA
jgi:hypothetical protein